MDTQKSRVRIDLPGNQDLKNYFSSKPKGHKCRLEIEFIYDDMAGDSVGGVVTKIAPEGYESTSGMDKEGEKEVEPTDNEPVAVTVSAPAEAAY
jgi:hypothetical protein